MIPHSYHESTSLTCVVCSKMVWSPKLVFLSNILFQVSPTCRHLGSLNMFNRLKTVFIFFFFLLKAKELLSATNGWDSLHSALPQLSVGFNNFLMTWPLTVLLGGELTNRNNGFCERLFCMHKPSGQCCTNLLCWKRLATAKSPNSLNGEIGSLMKTMAMDSRSITNCDHLIFGSRSYSQSPKEVIEVFTKLTPALYLAWGDPWFLYLDLIEVQPCCHQNDY